MARPIRVLAAIVLLLSGCAEQRGIPDRAGPAPPVDQAYASIVDDYGGLYADEKLNAWLAALGRTLAARSGRPDIDFRFAVLDSGAVNAFSTASGAIFVTRGLLALGESDCEVAGVLGHEIGHVVAGDQARRRRFDGLRDALNGAFAGFAAWAGIAAHPKTGLEFSGRQEFDADAFAVRIEAAAGFDPHGLAKILSAIDRAAASGKNEAEASVAYGDTHPLLSERVDRALNLAGRYQAALNVGRNPYLHAIDGMIEGDPPDQGYARGGIFIHPKAGFLFQIPSGFSLRNMPSALIGVRADGAAFIMTSATPGAAATTYDYLTDVWMAGNLLSRAASMVVNGRSGVIASARLSADRGEVGARVAVIGWSPSLVYRFISIGPGGNQADAETVLSAILNSFRAVAPNDLVRFPPLRLKVLTAKSGDTVESLAKRMAVSGDRENAFRILNGLSPGDRVQAGQQVKIAQ